MQVSNKIIAAMLLYVSLQMVGLRLVAATAAYDLVVVDADTNQPIKGVDVVAWFSNSNGWKAWTESAPEYEDKKTTDENGLCLLKGETNNGRTGVNIHHPPEGFYPNSFCVRHQFTQKPILPLMYWRPTDLVITAKLQRVGHPMPLFVKKSIKQMGSEAVEKNGGSFAYDFLRGSFLPPFGEGEVADIVLKCPQQEYIGEGFNGRDLRAPRYKNTVQVIFQGDEANGICVTSTPDAQAYCWIRRAPEEGYLRELSFSQSMAHNLQRREGLDAKRCYCFRVRVERDESGKIKSSLYGKIYGDPSFLLDGDDRWKQKIGGISFLYYLNPTPNDRNLEWDMKNNLCDKPGDLGVLKP